MPKTSVETHTADSLSEIRSTLSSMADQLDVICVAMRERAMDSLEVKKQAEMAKALVRVQKFVDAAREAFLERKHNVAPYPSAKRKGKKRPKMAAFA